MAAVKQRYAALSPHLDERQRRLIVAAETVALGPRSLAAVSRATGLARTTIRRGINELQQPEPVTAGQVRRRGAGRKRAVDKDPTLRADLERLIEPATRGDPISPLRWTCKSTRRLAAQLTEMGHQIGPSLVRRLLHELGYSLQANRKVLEGSSHPDRTLQFEHINTASTEQLAAGEPVISVDTKQKGLVGRHRAGADRLPLPTWHQQGAQDRASAVLLHQPELARQAADQLPGNRCAHRGHDND